MYFKPNVAFRDDAYLIFLRLSRTDNFLTTIIASKGHISASMASFFYPFHGLIKIKLSVFKLSIVSSKMILSKFLPIFSTSFLLTS
jgi:hypothetical protein